MCVILKQSCKMPNFLNIYKINSIEEIDLAPNDWHLCEDEKYKALSPWATIKHYFLVLNKGIVPAKYVTLETDNSMTREADAGS